MTCVINEIDSVDLRETLLFAVKNISGLLSMSTSADCGCKSPLNHEYISSIANDISLLAELAINVRDAEGGGHD